MELKTLTQNCQECVVISLKLKTQEIGYCYTLYLYVHKYMYL